MQRKIPRQIVDGVLLLDKSSGITSNAALQTTRRLLNAAKAGHTGTLDPMASGLLPLTFGEATKFSQMLLDADKCYEATLQFGIETDSGDADGAVTAQHPVSLDEIRLANILRQFAGEQEQIPPMFSALKRNGKPLYEYARAGLEVERTPRTVKIHALDLLSFDATSCKIRVNCSKGTYIRTLAMDIGSAAGCGAHLTALRRTEIGRFNIAHAIRLEEIEARSPAERPALLSPVDTLTQHLPMIDLSPEHTQAFLHGQAIYLHSGENRQDNLTRVYGSGHFLGLGQWQENKKLLPRRLIATPAQATIRISD